MMVDETAGATAVLMFSLTAHERLDVLLDQLDNISVMCPGSHVVLHLSHALWDEVSANPLWERLLARLHCNPIVTVNPDHLATKWAHMFHAHVSNIRLITARGIDYDRLVLLSSGDLIVLPGLERFANQWDMVVNDDTDSNWPWQSKVDADPVINALQSLAGTIRNSRSAHEGTIYSRGIIERMVQVLDDVVVDWNYNDAYPKEEVFLPTLSFMFPDARRHALNYHLLGFNAEQDYQVLCRVLSAVGLTDPAISPVLAKWAKPGLAYGPPPPFILSRVPRQQDSLLRMLLWEVSPNGTSPRTRFLASRLRTSDLTEFDKRTGWSERISQKTSGVLHRLRRS